MSVSKRVTVQNISYENEIDFHANEPEGETKWPFRVNSFLAFSILAT